MSELIQITAKAEVPDSEKGRNAGVRSEDNRLDSQMQERRGFIRGAIGTMISVIGVAVTGSAGRYLLGNPHTEQHTWTDAGELSEIRAGVPQEITFSKSRVDAWEVGREKASAWVIVDPKGEITAFSPLCTHLGCAYRWQAERNAFLCPCHGSSFSARGEVLSGPAMRPLDRYTVRVEDRRLWLGPIQPPRQS